MEEGFLPKAGTVLDIGCGAGSNLLYLASQGFRVHGIDLSPGAVAAARERIREAGLVVTVDEGDALALPFPDSGLDAVVDNGCFHTVPISRRERYATEVHRVLKTGGSLVLSWVAREHTGPRGPSHRPSLAEVTQLLESRFLFVRTVFLPGSDETGLPSYYAFLSRRTTPHPPRM